MVRTLEILLPPWLERRAGHFIGLSSMADTLVNPGAPSYSVSKAGFSNYLLGMALRLRSHGIAVTNVRFGFVDTKMAKAVRKPLIMTVDRAAGHLLDCLEDTPDTAQPSQSDRRRRLVRTLAPDRTCLVVLTVSGGIDAPICQDDRLGGLDVCLARSIVCHDPLVDLAGEEALEAPDDIAFGPAASSPSCDVVEGRLVESHADDDGSIEGGVGLSVATPIEAVPAGGHPGRGRDRTRAAELREGGFRANPVGVVPEDDQQLRRGVGADPEALAEGG